LQQNSQPKVADMLKLTYTECWSSKLL